MSVNAKKRIIAIFTNGESKTIPEITREVNDKFNRDYSPGYMSLSVKGLIDDKLMRHAPDNMSAFCLTPGGAEHRKRDDFRIDKLKKSKSTQAQPST